MTNGPMECKPVLSGLYLRFLEDEPHWPISATLYAATRAMGDIRVMEIKGTSDAAQVIELPQEEETLYFAYQFIGNSVISASGSWQLKSGQHFADTQQFVQCYTELFKISPTEERDRRR